MTRVGRKRVLETVRKNPGVPLRQIASELHMAVSSVFYHLKDIPREPCPCCGAPIWRIPQPDA